MLAHSWPGNVRELKKLVDLLVAGHDGPVSVEALKRLFGTMLAEDGADFAGEEQYRFALRDGLNAAVDRFIDSIIRRSMEENGGTKAQTLRDLRISTRILYASLRRTARHGRRRKS